MTHLWEVLKLVERVERVERDTRYRVLLAQYSVASSLHVLGCSARLPAGVVGVLPGTNLRGRPAAADEQGAPD